MTLRSGLTGASNLHHHMSTNRSSCSSTGITISAGERAVMAFDVLPNVMLVGETTNGAHGTNIGRELANGWFYTLVTQKVELSDGLVI